MADECTRIGARISKTSAARLVAVITHDFDPEEVRAAEDSLLFIGFVGIVAANAASFLVSHQAYGDPFLVTLAGFILGITLSAPRWAFGRIEQWKSR